ncbi:MAG: hypothetical protein HUJ75_04955, partial [Parasporobacterium sp.]|nr:hypothetical protein [Parasporobacterium sp.]
MNEFLENALKLNRNPALAREEYLTVQGSKKRASFSAETDSVFVEEVISGRNISLKLHMDSPGYLEIMVSTDTAFIRLNTSFLASSDFTDGVCDFTFGIMPEKLHNGHNFGSIIFRTVHQEIQVNVTVNNRIRLNFGQADRNYRRTYKKLADDFLDLRLRTISREEWAERTEKLLADING